MPGGNKFMHRFWSTEFARLGKTQEQFISECTSSTQIYEKYIEMMEEVSDR